MRELLRTLFKGSETEPSEPYLSKAFSEEVGKSRRLLEFLIVEERSCRVPDHIIEDIEACREKLKDGSTVSDKDRATITKAYRDLIAVPRCSVAYQRILPGKFWDAGSPWPWLFLAFGVLPAIAWVIIHQIWPVSAPNLGIYWYVAPALYAVMSLIVIWGFYAFTGVITDNKLNQLIGLCYMITAAVLVASVLPFSNPDVFEYIQPTPDVPLSVLKGCALARSSSAPAPSANNQSQAAATPPSPDIPKEVLCNPSGSQEATANATDYNFQWVINVGGTVRAWQPGTRTSEIKPTPSLAPAGEAKPPAPGLSAGGGTSPARSPSPSAPAGEANQQASSSPATPGPAAEDQKFYQISGGLVVPLYVIILAFFGSAVSMTRQVPVYQQRAMDSQDPFTNAEARRSLVFQIMQVLSAPLIAITVYYIYKPGTPAESVVVGFGSGFASEPILLMIRSLVEKLSPARPAATASSAVAIRAEPEAVELGPKQTKQFAAKIQGSTNQDVIWQIIPPEAGAGTISQGGLYSAPDFAAERTVTITATSAADRTKSASASVKLVLRTVVVKIAQPKLPMKLGERRQITAQVLHAENTEVSWAVQPSVGGGEIDQGGQYKAPDTAPAAEVTITATSKADPTKSDSVKVTFQS